MPKTIGDLLNALSECTTKIGVKKVMHEYGQPYGWSGTKAGNWVNNVWADPTPVKAELDDSIGPRTKMARQAMALGYREKFRVHLLKLHVRDLKSVEKEVYRRVKAETDLFNSFPCKETIVLGRKKWVWEVPPGFESKGLEQYQAEVLNERMSELLPEVDRTKDDDELLALLCRRGFENDAAKMFVYYFGHSEGAQKDFEVRWKQHLHFVDNWHLEDKYSPLSDEELKRTDWRDFRSARDVLEI